MVEETGAKKGAPLRHDEVKKSNRQPAGWYWVGVIAFAVMLAIWGVSLLTHGNTRILGTSEIERGAVIAAAFIGFGSFARWAVLRERAESLDE